MWRVVGFITILAMWWAGKNVRAQQLCGECDRGYLNYAGHSGGSDWINAVEMIPLSFSSDRYVGVGKATIGTGGWKFLVQLFDHRGNLIKGRILSELCSFCDEELFSVEFDNLTYNVLAVGVGAQNDQGRILILDTAGNLVSATGTNNTSGSVRFRTIVNLGIKFVVGEQNLFTRSGTYAPIIYEIDPSNGQQTGQPKLYTLTNTSFPIGFSVVDACATNDGIVIMGKLGYDYLAVMKVSLAGSIVWAKYYSIPNMRFFPSGIEYYSLANTIHIVGSIDSSYATYYKDDGFLIVLSNSDGSVILSKGLYFGNSSFAYNEDISEVSISPIVGTVLVGYYGRSAFVVNSGQAFTVFYNNDNVFNDVLLISRENTNSNYFLDTSIVEAIVVGSTYEFGGYWESMIGAIALPYMKIVPHSEDEELVCDTFIRQKTYTLYNINVNVSNLPIKDTTGTLDLVPITLSLDTVVGTSNSAYPIITLDSIHRACSPTDSGSIFVSVSGGIPYLFGNYAYRWSNGSLLEDLINVPAGNYTDTVYDKRHCGYLKRFSLNPPVLLDSIKQPICHGDSGGIYLYNISNATEPYLFIWKDDSGRTVGFTRNLAPITGGTYTLEFKEAGGCTVVDTFNIYDPPEIIITLDSIKGFRCWYDSGSVYVTVTGGRQPYTYEWYINGRSMYSTEDLINIPGDTMPFEIKLFVTDSVGCIDSLVDTITVPRPIRVVETHVQNGFKCHTDTPATIYIRVTGGSENIPPNANRYTIYVYDSYNNLVYVEYTGSLDFGTPLIPTPGTYTIKVFDYYGCRIDTNLTFTAPPPINIIQDALSNVTCADSNDGQVLITVTGGVSPYSFKWFDENGNVISSSEDLVGVGGGTYTVQVTDAVECMQTHTFVISEPPPIHVRLDSISTPRCVQGTPTANIFVTVSGGTPPYNYTWMPPVGSYNQEDLLNATQGSYVLNVTDFLGCQGLGGPYTVEMADTPLTVTLDSISLPPCPTDSGVKIYVTVKGGKRPYTFSWVAPEGGIIATTEDMLNDGPQGPYQLTVVDAAGCVKTLSVLTEHPSSLPVSIDSVNVQPAQCGMANGSITITVSGGTPPYNVQWSNGMTGTTITGLTGGIYSVTVTDSRGCSASKTIIVPNSGGPLLMVVRRPPTCANQPNGIIYVYGRGGTPPYSYYWLDNGSTAQRRTGLSGGTYTVRITDARECSNYYTIVLNEPKPIQIQPHHIVRPGCAGANNGAILIGRITGGTPPYSYEWRDANNNVIARTRSLYRVGGGTYTLKVTDANGCYETYTATLQGMDSIIITIDSVVNASCMTGKGGAYVTVSGGMPPYAYKWVDGNGNIVSRSEDLTNVPAGVYQLFVEDSYMCQAFETVLIEQDSLPTIDSFSVNNPSACGANDGSITVFVSGGAPPYNISWNNGDVGPTATNLIAGIYIVTITDSRGCSISEYVRLSDPAGPIVQLTFKDNASCYGLCDGIIDISVAGGTPPYTYVWSDLGTTEDRDSLCPGIYFVKVIDALGCVGLGGPWVITQPDPINIRLKNSSRPSCAGANDGFIEVSASGGTPPYTFSWDHGANGPNTGNVPAGTYQVNVRDDMGCPATASFSLSDGKPIQVYIQPNGTASCGNTVTLKVFASGGTPPYNYVWNDLVSGSTRTVKAGTYSVSVFDSQGCSGSANITIPDSCSCQIDSIVVVQPDTCGDSTGSITVFVSGGAPPYRFQWSTGDSTPSINNIPAGVYVFQVWDAAGCYRTDTIIVNDPSAPTVSIDSFSHSTCATMPNGIIWASATGGTPPYSYLWNSGHTLPVANGLLAGMYIIKVTDSSGCSGFNYKTINEPDTIRIITHVNEPKCFNDSTGSISIFIKGGIPPFVVYWTHGDSGLTAYNLPAGSYTVNVIDRGNCYANATILLSQPAKLTASVDSIVEPECNGYATGSITVGSTGGTPPYAYLWNTGDRTPIIALIPAGTYSVVVSDSNQCADSLTVTVSQPDSLTTTIIPLSNKMLYALAQGGTIPYTHIWMDSIYTDTLHIDSSGTYYVLTIDYNGCEATDVINIIVEPSDIQNTERNTCRLLTVSNSKVIIKCKKNITGFIRVITNDGKVLYNANVFNNTIPINLTDASGVYHIILYTGDKTLQWKVTKMK